MWFCLPGTTWYFLLPHFFALIHLSQEALPNWPSQRLALPALLQCSGLPPVRCCIWTFGGISEMVFMLGSTECYGLVCVCVCMRVWVCYLLSHARLFVTPLTAACQAPLSMEFSRQEYWSGLPFPSPGDLPDPGIEPRSPALLGRFFMAWATREALWVSPGRSCCEWVERETEGQAADLFVARWVSQKANTEFKAQDVN